MPHTFRQLTLRLRQPAEVALGPPSPRSLLTPPMPLISPARTAPTVAPVSVEHTRREVAASVIERVESVVEREVHRHLRFDSRQVRRLREDLYSDLGSRIVFERERMGRT